MTRCALRRRYTRARLPSRQLQALYASFGMEVMTASAGASRDGDAEVGGEQPWVGVLGVEDTIEQVLGAFQGADCQTVALDEQPAAFQEVAYPFDEFQTVRLVEVAEGFKRK